MIKRKNMNKLLLILLVLTNISCNKEKKPELIEVWEYTIVSSTFRDASKGVAQAQLNPENLNNRNLEYATIRKVDQMFTTILNLQGSQGWELVSFKDHYIFKRKKMIKRENREKYINEMSKKVLNFGKESS